MRWIERNVSPSKCLTLFQTLKRVNGMGMIIHICIYNTDFSICLAKRYYPNLMSEGGKILYVFDWELNQRINISFHNWEDETTDD